MKKFTFLLFPLCLLINTGFAQRLNQGQKVMVNNQSAHELISGLKIANPLSQLYLPFSNLNSSEKRLKSAATIKLDSVVISSRSNDWEPWGKTNKMIFEYDTEFRLVKISTTSGLDDWQNFPETACFEYNSEGMVSLVNIYYKDDQLSNMTLYMYIKFDYDDSGRLLKAYTYDLYDNNWELYMGKNYSYNESGQISEIFLEENWWAYWTSLHKYTYDLEGKLIRYEENPVYSMLATYNYNSEGNLTEENYNDWYQKRRHLFYYNDDGYRIKSDLNYWSKDWQKLDEDFIFGYNNTEEYEYLDLNHDDLVDLNLSIFNLNNELDGVEYCPDKLISTVYFHGTIYSFTGYKKTQYFYSSINDNQKATTEINDKKNSDFSVFPNPTTDEVTFTWKSANTSLNLKIFQLTGACIIDKDIQSNESVKLDKLTPGVYLYSLVDKESVLKSGKLIKK